MADSRLQDSVVARGLFGVMLQLLLGLRGLLLIPVLVRALPPSEVGVLNLGNALVGWVTPLLMLGLNTGFALRVVHLTGPSVRPAVLTVLCFSTLFSVTGAGVAVVLLEHDAFGAALSPLIPVLLPLGLLAVAKTTREVASVLPQIRQDLRFIGGNNVLMDFGGALLAIGLVLTGFGAYGALFGPAIMSLVGAGLAVSYSLRWAEGPWTLDRVFLTRVLGAALPVVPLALASWTLLSSDYFFVSYFQGTTAVAIYGLAYNLAAPVLLGLAAMNLTYLPTCVEILGRGRKEFASFIDASARLFSLAGVAAVAFTIVAGPALTTWFAGPTYTDAGRLLPVITGAYVLLCLAQLLQFVPGAMTRSLTGAAKAHAWAAAFNIVGTLIVVARFGYWGAAWTTLAAYGLALRLMARDVSALLPESEWPASPRRLVVLVVVSSCIALWLRQLVAGVLTAMVFGAFSMVSAVLVAMALGLITPADRRWVMGALSRRSTAA